MKGEFLLVVGVVLFLVARYICTTHEAQLGFGASAFVLVAVGFVMFVSDNYLKNKSGGNSAKISYPDDHIYRRW